jgi:hypothetical protein
VYAIYRLSRCRLEPVHIPISYMKPFLFKRRHWPGRRSGQATRSVGRDRYHHSYPGSDPSVGFQHILSPMATPTATQTPQPMQRSSTTWPRLLAAHQRRFIPRFMHGPKRRHGFGYGDSSNISLSVRIQAGWPAWSIGGTTLTFELRIRLAIR